MVKLFALAIAIVMSIPASAFAQVLEKTDKSYTEDSSVMGIKDPTIGLNKDPIPSTGPVLIKSDITTEETTDYIIEKSASLSKATGLINFRIAVKAKAPSRDTESKLSAIFAINENTDLKDIDLTKLTSLDASNKEAEIEANKATPGILENNDSLDTLALTTEKPAYGMVYYLSAKVDDEAMAKLDEKSPSLSLDIALKEKENSIYNNRYSLKYNNQEESQEEGRTVELNRIESLEEVEADHLIKGQYKEGSTNLFAKEDAQITWTDYILSKDDAEFAYNFELDQEQSTENSQILLEFFEAKEKGYIQNKSFTQKLPFAQSINLQVPAGQIAKISLTNQVADDKAKEFTFNGKTLANPAYKEDTKEEKESQKEQSPSLVNDTKEEDSILEVSDNEQNAQKADPTSGQLKMDYPYAIEYTSTSKVRYANNDSKVTAIPDFSQNPEIWWDIELDTSQLKKTSLDFNTLYYTLFMGAKDGLKQFRYKASTNKADLDTNSGYTTAGINAKYLYQAIGNIPKKKLGDSLYIRVKAPLDKDKVLHDEYSLGIRVNPDQNYINNILKEFKTKYDSLPTPFKWKIGDDVADKFKGKPFDLLDERIVATPQFKKYDVEDQFYFDSTRSITAERYSDTSINWSILDLIRVGETEDPNIDKAILNPVSNNSEKYYYKPLVGGGYAKTTNIKDVKLDDGSLYPGTIVSYNYTKQEGSKTTRYALSTNLQEKEDKFIDIIKNKIDNKTQPIKTVGGRVDAYTYKLPQSIIDDSYFAYYENPFNIMRINQNFDMVVCFNDGIKNPTYNGTGDKVGLQRIEDPDGDLLYNTMFGSRVATARRNLEEGGDFYQKGKSPEANLKDAIKRAYYYADKQIQAWEKEHDGKKIPRQAQEMIYQKMVHHITNAKPVTEHYALPNGWYDPNKNDWANKNHTLKAGINGEDSFRNTKESSAGKVGDFRKIPDDEARIVGNDNSALEIAVDIAGKAADDLANSYNNDDWNDEKADSVDLVFYKHGYGDGYQNLINGKVHRPLQVQKLNISGENLAGATFRFTNRYSGASKEWTSKEDNSDNQLYLNPGQYYVEETKEPKGFSKLDTFIIEVKETEINPDNGEFPLYKINIHVNDGYKSSIELVDDKNFPIQKDQAGNPLVSVEEGTLNLKIKNEDDKLGSIEFKKTNGKRVLDGAEFKLTKIISKENDGVDTKENGDPVYQQTSQGRNGTFLFRSMPEGIYKLEETKAPDGYIKGKVYYLEAKEDANGKVEVTFLDKQVNDTKQIINRAESTDLTFRKIKELEEGEDPQPLSSGVFRLYSLRTYDDSSYDRTARPSDKFVPADEENKTPALEVGEFRFTNLVEGEYILHEIQAPTGYQLPDVPFWSVKVTKGEEGLSYQVKHIGDNVEINSSDILRGADQTPGKTYNIENKARTIDWTFKKVDASHKQITGDALKGEDGNPVAFKLYEADYYGNKKDPKEEGKLIKADNEGNFNLTGLEYSSYYILEEVNPPKGYQKAADTVLYVASEAEVETGQMKVIVRDPTANTLTIQGKVFAGIIDFDEKEQLGELVVKKTGDSLIEGDDSTVGLRRAYFRLYHADSDFNYANENFEKVDKSKSYYYQRVTAGKALTDENNKPIVVDQLPEDQGLAKFENLKPGNYILEEHRGPAGYEKDPTPRHVTVAKNGTVTIKKADQIQDPNEKDQYEIFNKDESGYRIPLRITKKSENGSPLSGAKFQAKKIIEGKSGEYKEEAFDAVSEATGLAGDNYFRELSPGIYELTEIQTPRANDNAESDYLDPLGKDGKPLKWYFEVKLNENQTDPKKPDYMIIDYKFNKTIDASDKITDIGKELGYKVGDKLYGIFPIEENGKIINEEFTKLIKWVPDDGRSNPARPDAPYGSINDFEVTNVKKTTDFSFIKSDQYAKALEGAKFKLTKLETDKNGEIQKGSGGAYKFDIDNNGDFVYSKEADSKNNDEVKFENIVAGKYQLEEIEAPKGYEKLKNKVLIEFRISEKTGKWEQVLIPQDGVDYDEFIDLFTSGENKGKIDLIKNKPLVTELRFKKVDQKGDPVFTSAFTLDKVNQEGKPIDKEGNVLDENGIAAYHEEIRHWNDQEFVFKNLSEGRYKLVETNPTTFQQPSPTFFNVVKNEDGQLELVFDDKEENISKDKDKDGFYSFKNFEKIRFDFTKVGDDGKTPLYGAGFTLKKVLTDKKDRGGEEIYDENGSVVEELEPYKYESFDTSGSTGKIRFRDLSQGVYELEETNVPNGYNRLNAKRKWIITVEKNDAGDGLEVKYDKTYEKEYYESINDTSYNENDENVLTIDKDGITVKNTSNTIDLAFNKVDRNGKKIAKDTRFIIAKLSENPEDLNKLSELGDYKTYVKLREENGEFIIKDLDRGVYVLRETSQPDGFKLADRDIILQLIEGENGKLVINSFEAIKKDSGQGDGKKKYTLIESDFKYLINENNEIKIKNYEIPNFVFNKVKPAGLIGDNKIKEGELGITISQYDEDNNQAGNLVDEFTFDLKGTESINRIYLEDADGNRILEDGKYLIKESKAPKGYQMSGRSYLVEISTGEDGKVSVKLLEVRDSEGNPITNDNGDKITDTGEVIPVGGLEITADNDGKSTFQIVNEKPSLPGTGGAGTFIGFAIVGTAVMLAAIAYFGIYQNNKNRRRSNR